MRLSRRHRLTNFNTQSVFVSFLALFGFLFLTAKANAQVSINLGVQEIYDDNVFLEDDKQRPPFVVVDDLIEEDAKRGQVRSVLANEIDGKKDDDLITNVFLGMSAVVPALQQYATTILQSQVGFLLFSDNTSQNRITLDGVLDTTLTEQFLPKPFYATVINELRSTSSDSTAAEGTASRATQTYALTGRTGVRGVNIAPKTDWGLGYVGSYHLFLGELRLEEEQPGEIEEEGVDYHTHTAESEIGYDVSQALRIALVGTAGVQYFTSVESNTLTGDVDESQLRDELDRSNYTGSLNFNYKVSEKLKLTASVGVNSSSRFEEPQARTVTLFGTDGQSKTIVIQPDKTESSLLARGEMSYELERGSVLGGGYEQSVATDVTGQRLTYRTVFANGTKGFNDRLSLTLGGRFIQYSGTDDLSNTFDRFEGTSSLNFLLTQQTSLVLGYTYVDQQSTNEQLEDILAFRANDYQSNRVFIGITTGLVGLPL